MNFSKFFHRSAPQSSAPSTPTDRSPSPQKAPLRRPLSTEQPRSPASPRSAHKRSSNKSRHSHSRSHSSTLPFEIHPLNLPPEERDRLYPVMSAAAADSNGRASPSQDVPSSPPPSAPGAFPSANGVNGDENGKASDQPPRPPPHRKLSSSSPVKDEPPAIDPEECKAQGNKFFKAQQYDKAIAEYTKAIVAAPKSATYRSNRAAAYISANKYQEALEDAFAADELEPNNAKIMHRLARVYTNLGRPKEALDVYDRIDPPASATDRGPATRMQHHISQAEAQLKDGTAGSMVLYALDQAEKDLNRNVQRPKKWQLLRGQAQLKIGNANALGEAQSIAMGLLRENSQDPDALVLRGRALYGQGDNAKAIQHFKQALSCDPDFKEALRYLRTVQKLDRMKEEGNSLFKQGKIQQALESYTEALEVDPTNKGTNSKLYQNRALCNQKLKKYEEAISDCDAALKLDSSYTKAKKTRAKCYGDNGDWQRAVNDLKNIAESNPEEPNIARDVRQAELELKKSQRKDYYKILGLEKDCGEHEIKRAYKKMAIQFHPDKNPDDPKAEDKFKDVSEAYETLSDAQKRQRYDSGVDLQDPSDMFGGGGGGGMGGHPFGGGMGGMGGGVQIDPEMLFNMMNGGMGGGMGGMGGMGGGRGGPSFTFQQGGSPFGGGGGRGHPGGFPF